MEFTRNRVRHIGALASIAIVIACAFALFSCNANETAEPDDAGAGAPAATYRNQAAERIAAMSLEEKVAQLFIIRPEDLAGTSALVDADDETLAALGKNTPGGICYFDRNIVSPDQTRALLAQTQEAARAANGLPLLQCVDEEGGVVSRIANNPDMGVRNTGPAGAIGARGDPEAAYDAAASISDYLLDLGFNLDFTPDADIADGESNTIVQRAFGTTAEHVAPMVAAQIDAFGAAGILCSAKHFPGVGGVSGDSHDDLIRTDETLEQMASSEFIPFQAAIEHNVPLVMVGHIACPEIAGNEVPASLNPAIIGVLRNDLGYRGVIVTDSMEMGAIVEAYDDADQGVLALQAGADLLLLPNNYAAAFQGVLDAVKSGKLAESIIDEHATRVVAMKLQWADAATRTAAETDGLALEIDADVTVLPENAWGSFLQADERSAEWAHSFAANPAVRLKVVHFGEGGVHPRYFRDPAVITTAFNALAQLNVAELRDERVEDDETEWVFTMPDGSEKHFAFMPGMARVGSDDEYRSVDGNEAFAAFEQAARAENTE